jgi:hypothetical protein
VTRYGLSPLHSGLIPALAIVRNQEIMKKGNTYKTE